MAEPTLTYGSTVASSIMNATITSSSSFPSSSHSSFASTYTMVGGGTGGGLSFPDGITGGGSGNTPGATLILGPVFGSSALVVLGIVLSVRWKRHSTWRGVLGFGDPSIVEEEDGDDGPSPDLWDAYIARQKEDDTRWKWQDIKPLSATCIPPTAPPSRDDSSATLTACSTRTVPSFVNASRKDSSVTMVAASTCLRASASIPPRPSLPRMNVTVLIAMPSPPRSRSKRQKHASLVTTSSSSSEFDEKKLLDESDLDTKDRERHGTAELSLALGVAEVSIFDS